MEEQQTTPVALKEMEVQELVSRMRGELLRPGDVGYKQARLVYNSTGTRGGCAMQRPHRAV